jgi:hypothetical protein
VLLQPPTVYGGSLGDQALVRGAVAVLGAAHLYVPEAFRIGWQDVSPRVRLVSRPRMSTYDAVVVIGADCIDGVYPGADLPFDVLEPGRLAGRPARPRIRSRSMTQRPSFWRWTR